MLAFFHLSALRVSAGCLRCYHLTRLMFAMLQLSEEEVEEGAPSMGAKSLCFPFKARALTPQDKVPHIARLSFLR